MMGDLDELETIIADQRRELMAARAAESDLDLAFRLQMEEAIAASLVLPPSSSSSSTASSSSAPAPAPSASPSSPPPPHPSVEDDDGGLAHAIHLQDIELERFHLERRDTERCQAELRHVVDDLRRRAHDERFAREILQMSDDEWEDFGDEFQRPIELLKDEEEPPFRLYFKGMTKREMIRGKWVQLGAIAVAVCSPKDDLVLKIQKPVAFPGPTVCREVLETKALIEGLNAVASLGIERVDVFCDYKTLYNHVRGIWGLRRNVIASGINEVHLLQRKFKKCQMILLPRCHIKFVFRLARDALDSQITKNDQPVGSTSSRDTCIICLENIDSSQFFSVDGCLHRFCFSCMKQHVEVKLLHGVLPGCPHDGCAVKLNMEGASIFLTPRLLDIMTQRIKEASIPANEKVYCPYPKCSALMSLNEAVRPQQGSSSMIFVAATSGLRTCIKCKGSFCVNCKVPWHKNLSCYDYKRFNPHPHPEEAKLKNLARQKLWRQCAKCSNMIELAEGCFHMTCRCGHEFCYTCGAEWKDKKATCSCPLWDEGYIWYDDSEDDNFDDEDEDEDADVDDDDDDDDDDDGYHMDGRFY